MPRLDVHRVVVPADVTLKFSPNWTAVIFFAALGGLHLAMSSHAFLHGRTEGFLSAIFGALFLCASIVFYLVTSEVSIQPGDRVIRLRLGYRRLHSERFVAFAAVRNVRLTLISPRKPGAAQIELVCEGEVIDLPPTCVPRQEALCLAMTIGVPLTKVYAEGFGAVSERLDQLPPEDHES